MPRRFKEQAGRKQIAQIVKRGLLLLIALLITSLLVLIFSAGRDLWPIWVIAHRKQIVGILLLAVIFLILLSPILVEATSNTRTLSGPGKTYSGNRLDEWNDEMRR